MTIASLTEPSAGLAPMARTERIQALDVVRGFALIGIFLMNVEFYNRPLNELGQGLPLGLTGVDWLAGWLIYILVQGKFWTMFSLLFGMGFAVMLTRAERAGREFIGPYLRRIAALAVFGALHHVLIWGGDILFSYAVGAIGLLILLYGSWKYVLPALLVLIGIGFVPGFKDAWGVASSLALVSVAAMFLRGDAMGRFFGRPLPVFSVVFQILGALVSIGALAMWLLPGAPSDGRIPMTVVSVMLLLIGIFSAKFRDPVDLRPRRLGVAMYLFPMLMMTTFGAIQWLSPAEPTPAVAAQSVPASPAREANAAGKPDPQAEQRAERESWQREREADIAEERRVLSHGSYAEAVKLRTRDFIDGVPGQARFAILIIGMFLIGAWFVRSGVMENTAAHLPLFRRLALYGIPLGVGLGLLGTLLATSRTPGLANDPYQVAVGLLMIGNLPACLGYVSLIVLMLHSQTALARITVLAPLGRMALTNYLTHSVLGTLFFYGYGLGHWGTGRAWQVVFVAVVIALQLVFCHWWLSRYRFGPMEWVWRAITYWQVPPMRRDAAAELLPRSASA